MSFAELARRLSGQTSLILGWRPEEFWSATPAELLAILSATLPASTEAFDAPSLANLMQQFPDTPPEVING